MPSASIIHLLHHQQEHSASCLAACVVMVLSHWKVDVAEAEVRRIIKTKPFSGTHPINLFHLGELGFLAWPIEGAVDDLRLQISKGRPVIVFLWTGALQYWAELDSVDYLHAVVVAAWTETSVLVYDPALPEGPVEISWFEFKDAWRYSRHMMATIEPGERI